MIINNEPYLIEFNVRMGDPECQTILPRLKTDLGKIILACIKKKLDSINIEWFDQKSLCIVLCSKGYPDKYENNKEIKNLDKMKLNANENKYIFPYLFDDTQDIAKKYDAACTPDFFLYDKELKLVYRGQLDNSRPGNGIECDGSDLKYAITCILNNKQNERTQKPSIGCNIKWK